MDFKKFIEKHKHTFYILLMGLLLVIFSGLIVLFGITKIYWLMGTVIVFSIAVLILTEPGWEVRDWHTFLISGATIAFLFLISLWMQQSQSISDEIQGLSAIATVLMVFYVAIQTHATKQSIEEMRIQRLINVILPASNMLLEIKEIVKSNEKCLGGKGECVGYKPWREGIFGKLKDLRPYLKKSELVFATSLIPKRKLYQILEEYNATIISLRQTYNTLSGVLKDNPQISRALKTVISIHCGKNKKEYSTLCLEMTLLGIEYSQFEPESVSELKGYLLYLLSAIYSEKDLTTRFYDELIENLKSQPNLEENLTGEVSVLLMNLKEDVVRLKQLHKSIPEQIDKFIDEIKKNTFY